MNLKYLLVLVFNAKNATEGIVLIWSIIEKKELSNVYYNIQKF